MKNTREIIATQIIIIVLGLNSQHVYLLRARPVGNNVWQYFVGYMLWTCKLFEYTEHEKLLQGRRKNERWIKVILCLTFWN